MKWSSKTFSTTGIVLKRSKVGETDNIVTLLTPDRGKIVTVAKGVRKMTSSKRAALETGNYVKAYCVVTKSLPLLTQATLIDDCSTIRNKLPKIRQLTQLLEILEKLFVEEKLEKGLFASILTIRAEILKEKSSHRTIKSQLEDLIANLGYQHPQETKHASVLDYVSALANKPMRSFEYLVVKSS